MNEAFSMRHYSSLVIPAKAGIHAGRGFQAAPWTPAFAGVTNNALESLSFISEQPLRVSRSYVGLDFSIA